MFTHVVPDIRNGVRTPSTRTMFFTPGLAKVFLLLVCTVTQHGKKGRFSSITSTELLI